MSQFDVYAETLKPGRYVLNVQSDLLEALAFRVVIPLFPYSPALSPIGRLNPIIEVDGKKLVLMTHLIAPIPVKSLGPIVAKMNAEIDVVSNSLDMLLKGF